LNKQHCLLLWSYEIFFAETYFVAKLLVDRASFVFYVFLNNYVE
jgi:hypothetical protein